MISLTLNSSRKYIKINPKSNNMLKYVLFSPMSSKIKIITQSQRTYRYSKYIIFPKVCRPIPSIMNTSPNFSSSFKRKTYQTKFSMHLCYNIVFQRLFNSCCVLDFLKRFLKLWKKI